MCFTILFLLSNPAISLFSGIRYVRPGNNYVPNFNLTVKIDVNGDNRHPVFKHLTVSCFTC